MSGDSVLPLIQQLTWLLLGATLISIVARWLKVPYAVALVVGGLLVEESHLVSTLHLRPEVMLFAFLPPLLFDAAFRIDVREMRLVARPVIILAVPGVLITTFFVGALLNLATDLPLASALLFGSIVAATDPVAVTGVIRQMKLPARLEVIPEAESLVNDGMAITLYTALIGYATTGHAEPLHATGTFVWEVAGGVVVGVVMAFVFSRLTAIIDYHPIEMMLSTVLAYGSYLIADSLGASGALACVFAGFVHGSYGREIGMSAETSTQLDDLWEYLGFVANAFVFLLVGLSLNAGTLWNNLWPVLAAIMGVLAARIIVIAIGRETAPRGTERMPPSELVILFWAGMRGALSITLAFTLPASVPGRDVMIAMTFGVVLFTLVVQGVSLRFVIAALGLSRDPTPADAKSPHNAPAGP